MIHESIPAVQRPRPVRLRKKVLALRRKGIGDDAVLKEAHRARHVGCHIERIAGAKRRIVSIHGNDQSPGYHIACLLVRMRVPGDQRSRLEPGLHDHHAAAVRQNLSRHARNRRTLLHLLIVYDQRIAPLLYRTYVQRCFFQNPSWTRAAPSTGTGPSTATGRWPLAKTFLHGMSSVGFSGSSPVMKRSSDSASA